MGFVSVRITASLATRLHSQSEWNDAAQRPHQQQRIFVSQEECILLLQKSITGTGTFRCFHWFALHPAGTRAIDSLIETPADWKTSFQK